MFLLLLIHPEPIHIIVELDLGEAAERFGGVLDKVGEGAVVGIIAAVYGEVGVRLRMQGATWGEGK